MTSDHPFAPAYSRPFFFETQGVREALQRFVEGLGAREPFLLLTGEPGTGKTALVHEATARWESRVSVALLPGPLPSGTELLEEIIFRFGGSLPEGATRARLMAAVERRLAEVAGEGMGAMLVVDDAHLLSPERLEELRLLVNAAQQSHPLEVMLVGLTPLEVMLEDPAMAALRQRVSVRVRLQPLSRGEAKHYVRHRVAAAGGNGSKLFPRKTCASIADLSHGVPRQINALAGAALRLARESKSDEVSPEHVRAAATALWGAIPALAVAETEEEVEVRPAKEVPPTPVSPPKRKVVPEPPAVESQPPAGPAMSHDPQEWVARFGGPIQIGSRGQTESRWLEPDASEFEEPVATPLPREASPAPAPASALTSARTRGGRRTALTAALAGIILVTAVVLVVRSGGEAEKSTNQPATVATADSVEKASTPARRASAPATESVEPVAESKPARKRAAETAPASPTGRYTLLVAKRQDLIDAVDERDRVRLLTGFEGWVVFAPDGSSKPHQIVVGVYRSRTRAQSAANMLVRSRTLRSVTVVPLPPPGKRL